MTVDIKKFLNEKKPFIDEIIEKYIPRKFDRNSLISTLGPPSYEYSVDAANKAITEPVWDFMDRGGKRWRPVLFLLLSEALGINPEKFADFVLLPEMLHNGSIIVDDIEDMSDERRGKPALHKLYGEDIAINAGNALYFLSLLPLVKNKDKYDTETLLRIFSKTQSNV